MSPASLSERWAMLLETRKRSGEWVGTPVNVVVEGDRAYFSTPAKTGKVKRLRNFPDVRVAPCTPRGTPKGDALSAQTRKLDGDEADRAHALMTSNYPFVFRFLVPLEMRVMKTQPLFFELTGFDTVKEG